MDMAPSSAEFEFAAGPAPAADRLRGMQLASVLAALMMTLLLAALDQTIVNTALPRIIGDLNGFAQYVWVATAYLLTSTTMIPIVGKLSDQFGRKWFLVGGVVIFLVGSALSGTSQSMNQLILFRGLQGIGAGTILSLVFTLVGDIFVPAERARWQGLFTGVFALASVVGPTLGGWITDNASWRWVFYINLPVGVAALLLLIFRLPTHISARSTQATGWAAIRRIDFAGVMTASAATTCLMLGLTWGGNDTYAWSSPQVLGTLLGAADLYVLFAIIEAFFAAEPILPLDLFKNQVFAAGALLSLTVGMALFAVAFYLPLFIQGVLGKSATDSGLAVTPLTLALAASSIFVGQLIGRIGRYQFIAVVGSLVLGAGVFLLTNVSATTQLPEITRDMIVVGLGMGLLMPVLTLAVQNAIPRTRLGVGTGAVTYLRSMGQMFGVAVIGVVVNNSVATELVKHLPAAASRLPAQLTSADSLEQLLTNPPLAHQVVTSATAQAVAKAEAQASAQAGIHAAGRASAKLPPGSIGFHKLLPGSIGYQQWSDAHTSTQAAQQIAASVTQQVHQLFNQMLEATRVSLAQGISHGFIAGLVVCGAVTVIALFLKDVPLVQRVPAASAGRVPAAAGAPVAAREAPAMESAAEPELVPSAL